MHPYRPQVGTPRWVQITLAGLIGWCATLGIIEMFCWQLKIGFMGILTNDEASLLVICLCAMIGTAFGVAVHFIAESDHPKIGDLLHQGIGACAGSVISLALFGLIYSIIADRNLFTPGVTFTQTEVVLNLAFATIGMLSGIVLTNRFFND